MGNTWARGGRCAAGSIHVVALRIGAVRLHCRRTSRTDAANTELRSDEPKAQTWNERTGSDHFIGAAYEVGPIDLRGQCGQTLAMQDFGVRTSRT